MYRKSVFFWFLADILFCTVEGERHSMEENIVLRLRSQPAIASNTLGERAFRRLADCVAAKSARRRNIAWLWWNSEMHKVDIVILSAIAADHYRRQTGALKWTHIYLTVQCEAMINSLGYYNQIAANHFNANPLVVSAAIVNNCAFAGHSISNSHRIHPRNVQYAQIVRFQWTYSRTSK